MSSTAARMKPMKKMKKSSSGAGSSTAMAMARIGVGIIFLFFGEYKVINGQFAHEGYTKWVSGFVQESAVSFYKPFLKFTLQHHVLFGYAVGWIELLIGISMVLGFWVRPFAAGCDRSHAAARAGHMESSRRERLRGDMLPMNWSTSLCCFSS